MVFMPPPGSGASQGAQGPQEKSKAEASTAQTSSVTAGVPGARVSKGGLSPIALAMKNRMLTILGEVLKTSSKQVEEKLKGPSENLSDAQRKSYQALGLHDYKNLSNMSESEIATKYNNLKRMSEMPDKCQYFGTSKMPDLKLKNEEKARSYSPPREKEQHTPRGGPGPAKETAVSPKAQSPAASGGQTTQKFAFSFPMTTTSQVSSSVKSQATQKASAPTVQTSADILKLLTPPPSAAEAKRISAFSPEQVGKIGILLSLVKTSNKEEFQKDLKSILSRSANDIETITVIIKAMGKNASEQHISKILSISEEAIKNVPNLQPKELKKRVEFFNSLQTPETKDASNVLKQRPTDFALMNSILQKITNPSPPIIKALLSKDSEDLKFLDSLIGGIGSPSTAQAATLIMYPGVLRKLKEIPPKDMQSFIKLISGLKNISEKDIENLLKIPEKDRKTLAAEEVPTRLALFEVTKDLKTAMSIPSSNLKTYAFALGMLKKASLAEVQSLVKLMESEPDIKGLRENVRDISLPGLMKSPIGKALLQRNADRRFVGENIDFLEKVNSFKTITSQAKRREEFNKMCDELVKPNYINLPDPIRDELLKLRDSKGEIPSTAFEKAEKNIIELTINGFTVTNNDPYEFLGLQKWLGVS